jgi:hypothetical protein
MKDCMAGMRGLHSYPLSPRSSGHPGLILDCILECILDSSSRGLFGRNPPYPGFRLPRLGCLILRCGRTEMR